MTEQQVTNTQAINSPIERLRQVSTPKPLSDEPEGIEVGIIKGLSVDKLLEKNFRMLNGEYYDFIQHKWVSSGKPRINQSGMVNLNLILNGVADSIQFSRFEKDDLEKFIYHFFRMNYPNFIVYHKEFGLEPCDFNIIKTILFFFPLATFHAGWNAGHRNTARGVASENIQAKAIGLTQDMNKKGVMDKIMFWRKDK